MKIDELINKLTDLKAVNGNIDVFIEYDGTAVSDIYPRIYSNVTAKKNDISLSPWESGKLPHKFILIDHE